MNAADIPADLLQAFERQRTSFDAAPFPEWSVRRDRLARLRTLGVKVARLASIETCRRYTTALQYPQFDVFRQLASDCGAALENERYSDRVVLDAVVPVEREREFLRRVRETFSATVTPESGELISRPVAI